MAMSKTGQSRVPMGKKDVPWPSKVLVYKGEKGGFVPQPVLTNEVCVSCKGIIMILPDKKKSCQKCGAEPKPEENSR